MTPKENVFDNIYSFSSNVFYHIEANSKIWATCKFLSTDASNLDKS